METTAAVRLPSLLADFHRRFPAVRLSLRTATTADLVAGVLEGTLDGAFVAGPIEHADLTATVAFREELVLVTRTALESLAALRAGTPESGPTALVFRTGCTYRQRLEQVFIEFGWPSAARFELGTLDGMIGCVAADMGVTLLPRAVVERGAIGGSVSDPHAGPVTCARRDALHPAPQRASIQRAARFRLLPEQTRSIHRRLTCAAHSRATQSEIPSTDRRDRASHFCAATSAAATRASVQNALNAHALYVRMCR